MMTTFKRFLPLLILLSLMLLAKMTGFSDLITFETIKEKQQFLKDFVEIHPYASPFFFMLFYLIIVALSIPGATFVSLSAGLLFPQPFCTIYTVLGASSGAIIIFVIAKTTIGNFLKEKAGTALKKMEKGFQENAASYLLFLRLVPLFPFWLVNLAPALFGVRLFTFTWTTVVGIIPGAFVFTQAGRGLGAIFESGEKFSLNALFNNEIKIAFIGLALFALLPILAKKFYKKRLPS